MNTAKGMGAKVQTILDSTIAQIEEKLQDRAKYSDAYLLGILMMTLELLGEAALTHAHQATIARLVELLVSYPAQQTREAPMPAKHRLQIALALSPTNKAKTTKPDGDIVIVQEYLHEKYRFWVVGHDKLVWGGKHGEKEIDTYRTQYGVEPGADIWESM